MGGVLSDVRYSSSYLVFDLRNEFLLSYLVGETTYVIPPHMDG
jgi:hypothetical protein